MICDREPQSPPVSSPPTTSSLQARRELRRRRLLVRRRKPEWRPPRRVRPGSLRDIMRHNASKSLFVRPLCWTDQHAQLLGVRFNELPCCDTPMPDILAGPPPSKAHVRPSRAAMILSNTLTDLVSPKTAHPVALSNAIRTIMSTLWPDTFNHPLSVPELHIYYGDRVYRDIVRPQILWTYNSPELFNSDTKAHAIRSGDSEQSWISRSVADYYEHNPHGKPMICYLGKAQLASIRRNMFRISSGPNGQYNEPVYRLQQLRSKRFVPSNPDEDSHIAGVMLAMAQKHFYSNPSVLRIFRPGLSPAEDAKPFHNVKARVITHDAERAEFIVYIGHMTTTFLERFRRPHRPPPSTEPGQDTGLKIDYVRVPIWPILGLRERLGKALGEDIVGRFDADVMKTWEEDKKTPCSSGSKRKRTALGEAVNRSFDESEGEPPSPAHGKRQCIRQGTPVQAVA